jgi:type II secretory pathway pseudopilin PulG
MRSEDLRLPGRTGLLSRARCAHPRAGISLVEIVVALSVLVVAASIFCQTLLSTTRMRHLNRENSLAADAARVLLERMRNEPFLETYRDFNEDPKDDPGGNATGPGHLFEVPGLEPLDGAPGGMVGRVFFPSLTVEVAAPSGGKKGGIVLGGATVTQWHLREDVVDEGLGMPRDLNGNNVIDTANHSSDYLVLPVRVRIEWKSGSGARRFEIVTQLGDFRLEDAP